MNLTYSGFSFDNFLFIIYDEKYYQILQDNQVKLIV